MVVGAVIALVVIALVTVLGSIRNRRLVFNKPMLIVTAVAIGILVFNHQTNGGQPSQPVPEYVRVIPPAAAAPFVYPTDSRSYFVKEYYYDGDTIVLMKYYHYEREWTYSDKPLPLPPGLFGEHELIKR